MTKNAFLVDPWRASWYFTQALLSKQRIQVVQCLENILDAQIWLLNPKPEGIGLGLCIISDQVLTQSPQVRIFLDQLHSFGIRAIALSEFNPNNGYGDELKTLIKQKLIDRKVMIR